MAGKFEASVFVAKRGMAGVFVVTLLLAGCSKKDGDRPVGEVIAHVGADDVTIQELENEFRLANVPADKRSDANVKKALEAIVTRKAVARQAMTAKFDREPTVQLDVLRDKEEILARTFLQRKLSTLAAGVGESDLDQYTASHPAQFANRVIFVTDQLEVPARSLSPAVGEATKNAKSIAEVEQKLAELKIPSKHQAGAFDSATLPAQMTQQLQANKASDVFFIHAAAMGVFFKVVDTKSKPLTGADASNLARQMIVREKAEALNKQAAADARASATYEGDYARIMKDARHR